MAKKKIEEMNEQELAAEKAASSVEVVDNATEAKTEHPMLRTEVKETLNVAPIAGGTVNEQGQTVAAPLNKNVQMSVDTRTAKQKRQETNAGNFLNALEAKEQELGRELTMQEIADFGDAKGLWAYQALNNKKGNWGDAFGGNELFGRMNKNTYDMIRKDLNSRATAKQAKDAEDSHWNKEIAIVPMGDGLLRINKKMQTEMKNWGSQITDPNYITPEQAKQLYATLNSYGIETPEVTGPTTLGALIDNIDDEAADVMQALGFYDNGFNQVTLPKNETFEEIMARREKAEEAMRLQSQQRALERQRARIGLADLAAGVGDMIKASNGAIVTPRDYQAMYDTLTAQQKVNYNNYLARMQAMKEAEKAKAKEAADRAYQERLLATQHERDMEKLLQAQGFQAGEAQKERNWKSYEASLDRALKAAGYKTEADIAAVKENNNGVSLSVGDKTFMFRSKDQHNSTVATLYGALLPAIAVKVDNGYKLKEPYSTIMNNMKGQGVDTEGQARAVVLAALRNKDVLENDAVMKEAQKVAEDNGYEVVNKVKKKEIKW